ncbi:MAG TPA: porin [Gemmatimonadaceae bacterium]|nr:porin [Gemmatimonadaceae bacterium]
MGTVTRFGAASFALAVVNVVEGQAPDSQQSRIAVNAFISSAYEYNANRPTTGASSYRVFDYNDNSFNVDVAELVAQVAAGKPKELGIRIDVVGGKSIPRISKAQDRSNTQFDVQQLFASYIAPLGSGLRFDVGKYVTHLGYELIEGYDGYNDNYSRSLLFGYAIPFTHTGAKASYAFSDKVSAMVEVVNGWDLVRDNNRAKSVGAQLTLTPASPLALYLNWIGGPELADDNHARRNVFDVVATLKATPALTVGVNTDYGTENGTSRITVGDDAVWKGVAGYATYALSSKFSLALRGERFRDEGGTRLGTDTPATLSEATFTPTYKFTDHIVLRGEVRHDWSDRPIIAARDRLSEKQTTAGINFIVVY